MAASIPFHPIGVNVARKTRLAASGFYRGAVQPQTPKPRSAGPW
ncbi:hypothetical protein XHC_3736 [Xanthomonas hortorum pv. carotae str. M081]|nr:hypothetical protein XHC_3736 [Xanthomonas hortorum pv. carotae str. M081]